MKIFTGEIPENPCEKCQYHWEGDTCRGVGKSCANYLKYLGQQSILTQCKEVGELEDILREYMKKHWVKIRGKFEWEFDYPLEQFIQEQIPEAKP